MKILPPFILDAHLHCWDRVHGLIRNQIPVAPLADGRLRVGDDEIQGMPSSFQDCRASAERIIAEWDWLGVHGGVLVQEYLDGEQNQYTAEILRRFPERFRGYALPDFFNAAEVVDQSIRLLESAPFAGIKICGGHIEGLLRLDSPELKPLWQYLEASQLAVSLDFAEGTAQVAEFEPVLQDHPQLRVAIGHFAMPTRNGWPDQLQLAARYPNVVVESGGIVWLYRDDSPGFPTALEAICRARDTVGIESLMWGSDWPRTMCDYTYQQSYQFVLDGEALNDSEKLAFLGGNAARFYGFPSPHPARNSVPPITAG